MERDAYAAVYGPALGDRVRLGDTDLWVEVTDDRTEYGEEAIAGWAGTIRDGLAARAAARGSCDLAITNCLLLDPVLGVVKASIGIRDGRGGAGGRAGNPYLPDGIAVAIGPGTAIVGAEGLIATPGAVDSHVHLLSPALAEAALASGVTTVVGQDYGPIWNLGANPPWALERQLAALDAWPLNVALLCRGSASRPETIEESLLAGAAGLKIHEDVGATRTAIEQALRLCDAHDVQLAIHTDGLNESLSVEDTLEAFAGRTVHAFHIEGCGGGHAPDLLRLCGEPNVICSSTNPTIPYGESAAAEHEEMIMVVHYMSDLLPGNREAAGRRVRPATMGAEDVLHDLGLIAITSSDSQGMGRIGETVRRTFQLAHKLKGERGAEGENDNERVLRYLAKLTINPALAHGLAHEVGSLEPGKLADVVLWQPAFFAVKPELVLKSGFPAYGAVGEPNASTLFAEPVGIVAQFGACGPAAAELSVTFVAAAALDRPAGRSARRRSAVRGCRTVSQRAMVRNDRLGSVRVTPDGSAVTLDGKPISSPPAAEVPLSRRYLLV